MPAKLSISRPLGLGLPGTLPGYVSSVKNFDPNLVPKQYAGAYDPKVTGTPAVNAALAGAGVAAGAGKVGAKAPAKVAAPADPWASIIAMQQSAIQTPAQIAKMANDQALAREQATLASQKAVSDQAIAQYNDQATRAQGFAQALAKLQSGEDQQAEARYNDAAGRLTGIGTGLTGAVSDSYQGSVDAAKAAVARLTGGLGEVTAPEAADLRNAAQYSGVTGPAGSLVADAGNAARMAQSDAAWRAQNLAHIGQGYSAQADTEIAKAASDARALIAQRPSTIAELVSQLNTNRSQGISNLASILGQRQTFKQQARQLDQAAAQIQHQNRQDAITNAFARRKETRDVAQQVWQNTFETNKEQFAETDATKAAERANRQIDLTSKALDNTIRTTGASITGYDPVTHLPTFSNDQAQRQFNTSMISAAATLSQQNGYRTDWNPKTGSFETAHDAKGNVIPLAGNKLTKDGQGVIKTYAPSSTTGRVPGTGMTGSQFQTKVDAAQKDAIKWAQGPKTSTYTNKDGEVSTTTSGGPALSYQQITKRLLSRNPSKAWKQQVSSIVDGLFDEGEGGRPYTTPALAEAKATTNADAAFKKGLPYRKAIASARKYSWFIPFNIAKAALDQRYYGGRYSPIPGGQSGFGEGGTKG